MADTQPVNVPSPQELVNLANTIRDSITVELDRKTASMGSLFDTLNGAIDSIVELLQNLETAIQALLNTNGRNSEERERIQSEIATLNAAHNDLKEALTQIESAYEAGVLNLSNASTRLLEVPTTLDNKVKQPIETMIGLASTQPPAGPAQPPAPSAPVSGGRKSRKHRVKKGGYVYGKKHSSKTKKMFKRSSRGYTGSRRSKGSRASRKSRK